MVRPHEKLERNIFAKFCLLNNFKILIFLHYFELIVIFLYIFTFLEMLPVCYCYSWFAALGHV